MFAGTPAIILGGEPLSKALYSHKMSCTKQHCQVNNRSSCSRVGYSQIRLTEKPEPLLSCYASFCSLATPQCSLGAPPCSLDARSMLPLKRPCSLSRPRGAVPDPKFGVYIIYIYIYIAIFCEILPKRERPRRIGRSYCVICVHRNLIYPLSFTA